VSYLLLPHGRRVVSPPFASPPPLWHRRRPESGDRSGCAAPSRATQAEAGPASAGRALRTRAAPRVAVGRARAVHVGRADAADVGQAPLCIWVERGFGPVALKLIFLFSEYI
jgi:hypothetical protein